MSNQLIYEITQLMRDTDSLHGDMKEAMDVIQNMFKKKYINKMQKAVQTHQLNAKNNPTKEIQLMSALKPFMPESNHKAMDQMIHMMLTLHAASNIQRELGEVSRPPHMRPPNPTAQDITASSIHEDGVYDVDDACMADRDYNRNNFPELMLAMMMVSRK